MAFQRQKKSLSLELPTSFLSMPRQYIYVATSQEASKCTPRFIGDSVIVVDIEGDLRASGRLSLVQIEALGQVYIFDIYRCPDIMAFLKPIFECPNILKVIHDCRRDSQALRGQFGISLQAVFDTQCADAIIEGKEVKNLRRGLNEILSKYANRSNPLKETVKHRDGLWKQRPLPAYLLMYAAYDVQFMRQAYVNMEKTLSGRSLMLAALQAS